MYRLINQNREAIIADLSRINDVAQYLQLREDMRSGRVNVESDSEFQRRYRTYWRMNVARLGTSFYAKYFQLLARCQQHGSPDIGAIVRDLAADEHGEKQWLQFSFATKLAHMVDPRTPVYDSFVAAFYFYAAPTNELPFSERLSALLTFHSFLQREYKRIIHHGLLNDAIQAFRARFQIDHAICPPPPPQPPSDTA